MKINRITAVVAIVLAIVVFNMLGFDITAALNLVIPAIPIALVGYLLILAKRYVDAKASEPKIFTDMHAKIVLLNESMGRIEKKVDKIDKILEKVSD